MQVGLFFGSFNPIHIGHLIIAQSLLNESQLDQVWLVVSPQNPFKEKKTLLNEYDRLVMAELATQDNDRIKPSNVEFRLPQPSYTIDTLTHLAGKYPSYRFSILMGQDNLAGLHKWKNYEAILAHYPIYVYPRLGAQPAQLQHPNIHPVAAPIIELSATRIRELLKARRSVQYMVPPAALKYIEDKGLYVH